MRCRQPLLLLSATTVLAAALTAPAEPGTTNRPLVIPFEIQKPGQVSAVICDAKGQVVRELLHAVPRIAGKHFMVWDGLDRDGKSVPAGDYTWKLLQTPGLKASYVMSVGSSFPPGTDWSTACGPGTHATPFGIAVDRTGIYVAANTTENIETCVLKLPHDGTKRLWSALHPRAWDGALSLAVDGGEVFMLGHVTASDGRIEPAKKRKQLVYVYDATTGKLARRTLAGSAVGDIPVMIDVQWDQAVDTQDATDMDAHDGALVVAYGKHNALRWYDPKSGALLDTVHVPSPQGIAVGSGGVVYATTADRIVALSRKERMPRTVTAGLDKPGRIDVDRGCGEILVYEAGTQQIKRFSGAGKLLVTYGEKGGRPEGLYNAKAQRSFAGFADLCADGAGGFFVTESTTAPRRTAHFNRNGNVIREWYGGQRWAPHAVPEGDNPNVLWIGSHYGWIMRVLVDYEAKTWKVHSCYKYTGLADGLVGDSHNEGCYFRVYKKGSSTYIVLERLPTVLKVDDKNWRLLPVTVCGGVGSLPAPMKAWAAKGKTFQWNDVNGDGKPQQHEFTFYDGDIPGSYEPYVAGDFTCYVVSHDRPLRKLYKFAVTKWNDVGAPIYGNMPGGVLFGTCPARFDARHFADSRWSVFLHQDAASGNIYAAFNDWTRDWCDYADSFMHQWSPAGVSKWTVGQRGVVPVLPGEVHMHLRGVAGVAHDCVVAIDVEGGWYLKHPAATYVWDRDGLYVGGLMDHPNLNGMEKHWYQCGGEFCHAAVHTLPSGDVLFFGNWENEVRIYRVTGWNDWLRQSGTIRLDAARPNHTGQGLTLARYDDPAMTRLRSVAIEPQLDVRWAGPKTAAPGMRWSGTIRPDYGPVYTGPWTTRSDKDCFDGSMRGSRDNDASVAFRFHGKSIQIVGVTSSNHGLADVSLDGKPQQRVDCYSAQPKHGATLFSRDGLPDGDHKITLTVVGWYGKPRHKDSSDAWVFVDKFVVDGRPCDDAGYPYIFSIGGDGKIDLWINRQSVIQDKAVRPAFTETSGPALKLLRKPYSLQLNQSGSAANGGVRLYWSSPPITKSTVPKRCLTPVIPGAYTVEDFRSPSLWGSERAGF